jgi:hypothetical protein
MGETAHLQLNSNSRETNPSEFNRELTVFYVFCPSLYLSIAS